MHTSQSASLSTATAPRHGFEACVPPYNGRYLNADFPALITIHEAINMAEIPVTIVDTRMPILPYATTDIPSTSLTPHPLAGHPGQNNPPQEESGFADSSGPLFSMYLQLAGEEDKKMTESWKGDADGILIFVSRRSMCGASTHIHPEVEDWFILRRRGGIGRGVRAGSQAKFPGHISILPRKHLSNPRQFEWHPGRYSPHTSQSVHPIFPTSFCRMGQLTLVSQLGHQSHMRTFGHITATMGAPVHEGHPDSIQSAQTSKDPCILCRGC